MYMYVYVCICMYMYVYVCICMHVYVCICVYMCERVCISMYMYVPTYVRVAYKLLTMPGMHPNYDIKSIIPCCWLYL